jgi:preprotein translocase subunit SecF
MFQLIKSTNIDFLSKSKYFVILSSILCILSAGIILTKGFNYGIDFAGGTIVQVQFEKTPNLDNLRKSLNAMNLGDVVIQNFGDPKEVLIRVEQSNEKLTEVSKKIKSQLEKSFKGNKFILERVEQVGPKVGKDLKGKALMAIAYALVGILIYVSLRFEFVFSLGAVLALAHDILITMGVFSLIGKEINLPIIAAALTVVGYSLNDTIVVFDRIRERLKSNMENLSLKDTINLSLNETLSRTILTSLTTLLAVLSLYLFGGEVINGFAFALLIGIMVGTYSSIGVASALVFAIKKAKDKTSEKKELKKKDKK